MVNGMVYLLLRIPGILSYTFCYRWPSPATRSDLVEVREFDWTQDYQCPGKYALYELRRSFGHEGHRCGLGDTPAE